MPLQVWSLFLATTNIYNIPVLVQSLFSVARSPKQWHANLVNFYENVYSKELKGGPSGATGEEGKTEQKSDGGEIDAQEGDQSTSQ